MKRLVRAAVDSLKAEPMLRWAVAAWVVAALALAVRIPFGTGTTDEPFYSAMPYGFLLGNKPYKDELAFHQNAGILLIPIFRVYTWLFGAEGLVVFNRWLYFAYIGVCSVLCFRLVKKLINAASGAWAAALVLTFSYFNIFALSYNTLGALGVLAGTLLSAEAVLEKRASKLVAAWGCFVTAAFSYPTFACVAGLQPVLLLLRLRKVATPPEFRRCLVASLSCALVAAALAGLFVVWVTPSGIERALEFSKAMGYGADLAAMPNSFFRKFTPYLAGYALVFVASPILLRHVARAVWPVVFGIPMALGLLYMGTASLLTTTRAQVLLTAIPLLAPVCLLLAPSFRYRWLVLEQLWLPALLSMVIVAKTSANANMATHLGVLPALIAGVIGLGALAQELTTRSRQASRGYRWLDVAFGGAVLATQVHSLFDSVYTEGEPIRAHTTLIRRGPLLGALATPEKAKLLEAVDADLKSIESPGKTLAVFDDFVIGYLSTRMRPRTFSHWVIWGFPAEYEQALMRETYGNPEAQPDYVLILPPLLRRQNAWSPYRINYEKIIDRPELGYLIEQRVSSDPVPPPRTHRPRRVRRRT